MACSNVRYCLDSHRAPGTHPDNILSLHAFKALIGNGGYNPDQIRVLMASSPHYDVPAYRNAAQAFIDARTPKPAPVSPDETEPQTDVLVVPVPRAKTEALATAGSISLANPARKRVA